ncbi:MAG: HAD family phosphatase [Bacteroidia bacterium]|nr:HAD family phosphatase [Bacteroidia bacterium]
MKEKVIIFDFGNILISLDFERSFRAFEDLLNVDWSDRMFPGVVQKAIYQYDRGRISDEEFAKTFHVYNPDASFADIYKAWNTLLGIIPSNRFEFLLSLKAKYKLALLSNINNLHLNEVHHYLRNEHSVHDFEERFFDQVFYSHIIGKRKPDLETYRYVEENLGISGENILFIDDMEENVLAARNCGWNACVHNPAHSIENKFSEYLIAAGFE